MTVGVRGFGGIWYDCIILGKDNFTSTFMGGRICVDVGSQVQIIVDIFCFCLSRIDCFF